jgi:hypothetical protein
MYLRDEQRQTTADILDNWTSPCVNKINSPKFRLTDLFARNVCVQTKDSSEFQHKYIDERCMHSVCNYTYISSPALPVTHSQK